MMRVAAVVQVRMGSTRLPGKAMMDVGGIPLLGILLTRLKRSESMDGVVVATTDLEQDDVIAEYCKVLGFPVFRGDAVDVLSRYIGAADHFCVQNVVRVTGDNPLTDIRLMEELISLHFEENADYTRSSGFPLGTSVEVAKAESLRAINRMELLPSHREHVTLYFNDHTERFKVRTLKNRNTGTSSPRLTVDTDKDLELIRAIGKELGDLRAVDTEEVLNLLEGRPDLRAINSEVPQKDPWK